MINKPLKYFSTFSGIGGFELGIEQAYEKKNRGMGGDRQANVRLERKGPKTGNGPRARLPLPERSDGHFGNGPRPTCVGYSEIDPYAIKIYEKHFPQHKNFGNIKRIKAASLPDFDLLVGGFPCQAFSIAGKRRGFEDTRGTLFFDLARILKAKQPRFFVFENVKGLLSHDSGRTFRTIIGAITDLGYDAEWQVLNSKNFGVPQNRERIYIVGHLRGTPRPEIFPVGQDSQADIVLLTLTARYYGAQANGGYIGHEPQEVGTIRSFKDKPGFRPMKSGLSPAIRARARQDGDGQPVILTRTPVYGNGDKRRVEVTESDTVPTLRASHHKGGDNNPLVRVKEATKAGFAEAFLGDSINLSVMGSKTRRGRVGKGIAQTLDTGMQQHTLDRTGGVRRLTPIECERLQGFPDNWTSIGVECSAECQCYDLPNERKAGEHFHSCYKAISDTQRYKTLGNAVTVNVVAFVMSKLI